MYYLRVETFSRACLGVWPRQFGYIKPKKTGVSSDSRTGENQFDVGNKSATLVYYADYRQRK
jgi:hypothetical protein